MVVSKSAIGSKKEVEDTANEDEGKEGEAGKGGNKERKRTGELILDGTEIGPVHGLDELCLVEREDFVADGEERHLTRASGLHGITFDKDQP